MRSSWAFTVERHNVERYKQTNKSEKLKLEGYLSIHAHRAARAKYIFVAKTPSNLLRARAEILFKYIINSYSDISRLCSGKLNVVFTDVSMLLFCQYDYLLTCKNLEL